MADPIPRTLPSLTEGAVLDDPHRELGRLREVPGLPEGSYLGGTRVRYVTRDRDVRALLSDDRFTTSPPASAEKDRAEVELGSVPPELAPYVGGSLQRSDGVRHAGLRRLVSSHFTVRAVEQMRPRIVALTSELLDGIDPHSPVDLLPTLCYPLPMRVVFDLVGIPHEAQTQWRRWSTVLATMDTERLVPALREIDDHLRGLLETARANPGENLLGTIVLGSDRVGDELSEADIGALVLALVFGGYETTAHLIGNSVVALLSDQAWRDALQNPHTRARTLDELVRLCSPVMVAGVRFATQDMEFGDEHITRGEPLLPVLSTANRDSELLDEEKEPPECPVSNATTSRRSHVSFGHGRHFCLGAALARQELEIVLGMLWERFPNLKLAAPRAEPDWDHVPGSRRLATLTVLPE